jgi:hypothetical protein
MPLVLLSNRLEMQPSAKSAKPRLRDGAWEVSATLARREDARLQSVYLVQARVRCSQLPGAGFVVLGMSELATA